MIDRALLRRLAGARSFERGEDYFERGRVGELVENDGVVAARVEGSSTYRVRLSVERGEVEATCTCPLGDDGIFCKHVVAVGLAIIGGQKRNGKKHPAKKATTLDDVKAMLRGRGKNDLVELIVAQAIDDERLRQRLLLEAATERASSGDTSALGDGLKDAIDRATVVDGFVGYREAYGFARGIDEVVDAVEKLVSKGHAAEAIEACEHALERIEEAMESADDSDGELGSLLSRVQEIHLAACKKARPDGVELAQRLFEWELSTGYDTFYGAAATYRGVLGDAGLAEYRRLADAEWARVPALKPGGDDKDRYGRRFRITHMMETFARLAGDVEAEVAVLARDLSHAYAYLRIAERYREAKQPDRALEWAERGLAAFPERTDSRLREFVADEYHRRKRHDDAMALVWAIFTERPALEGYRLLKGHAERAHAWKSWRTKALDQIRAIVDKERRAVAAEAKKNPSILRRGWAHRADHSLLVEIVLFEKDVEAAWREAKAGGCREELWMDLAARREKGHPADALEVYRARIDPTVSHGGNESYREAVGLLRKVRQLLAQLGRADEFPALVATARATHKAKRNFVKMLDGARWS